MMTMVVGIPAAIVANLAILALLAKPAAGGRRALGGAVFVLLAIIGAVLTRDALSLFRSADGTLFGILYLAFYALAVCLSLKLLLTRSAAARENRDPP